MAKYSHAWYSRPAGGDSAASASVTRTGIATRHQWNVGPMPDAGAGMAVELWLVHVR
jgi:hypothetical protein